MKYEHLKDLYYKNETAWEAEYKARFNGPFTKHIDIRIHQYNYSQEFPLFFCYTEEMVQLLMQIQKLLPASIESIRQLPPIALQQFITASLIEEVKSTNEIEGVRSSREEIKSILALQGSDGKKSRLWGVINEYVNLTQTTPPVFRTCEDIRHFYDEFALEEVLSHDPDNGPDGKIFRKESVSIIVGSGRTIHQGITPEAAIITMMDKSLALLHDDAMPLLVRVAIFHYLFGYIHPFYDGNGRTSRFITSSLLAKELHLLIALRLSLRIKKKLPNYYKLFTEMNSSINRGDLTPFILGFLQIIIDTITNTHAVLSNKSVQLKKALEKLRCLPIPDKTTWDIYCLLLQATSFSGSGITMDIIQTTLKKSRNTIQHRIDSIPENHLLIDKSEKPYQYKLNLMLLKNISSQ